MTDNEWAKIGQAVRARRTQLAVTQKDAAQAAGVSDTTWLKIEAGQVVGDLTLRKAARPLRWTTAWVDELLAGQEPTEESQDTDAAPMTDLSKRFDALDERMAAIEQALRDLLRRGS